MLWLPWPVSHWGAFERSLLPATADYHVAPLSSWTIWRHGVVDIADVHVEVVKH